MIITLPDGSKKEFKKGVTGLEIAASIGQRLAKDALAILVDEEMYDLSRPIEKDASVEILTYESAEGKKVFLHSAAHLLAQAVKRHFPEAKLTIGPALEDSFYYDIDHAPFTPDDLKKIEEEMAKIVKEDFEVKRKEVQPEKAKDMFADNEYKQELIDEYSPDKTITIYTQGEFTDLCEGPHIPNTGKIKAFKLTKLAGAYWRADQSNKQLQRIYGVAFPDGKMLDAYIKLHEEAEKRDHRKLGKELELFHFHDWSPGSPIFLPKGTIIYNKLVEFIRAEYRKRGYTEVITPQLFHRALWEQSGHWQHFKDDMFVMNVDDAEYSLKPMNCPSHVLIFKSKSRSYRDLPLRIADFCNLHRNELKGVLGGLTRVRKFSQDDAHIFCTPEQIKQEILALLDFVKFIYNETFDFAYTANLSTKPDKAMGEGKLWEKAEQYLREALDESGLKYTVKKGEGAFYGPKIDFDVKDALGRTWQLATIQLDFQMPMRMDAVYEGTDSKKHNAVMIHRAILGSIERFIAVLIEHYAGKLPLWLSPRQVRILTVADRFNDYANRVAGKYSESGILAEVDERPESVSKKVREAQLDQVNYILVVGEKEIKDGTVTVRTRNNEVVGARKVDEFLEQLKKEIRERK